VTKPAAPTPFVLDSVAIDLDSTRVLDDVTLAIEQGEFVALLGENGSGKTTLLRAMLGLAPVAQGELRVLGVPVGRFSDWASIAYVPQRLMASTSVPVSVLEAVRSARFSPRSRWRLRHRDDHDAAQHALERVGLWHRRHDRLDTLSGGQQRRVMVARALAIGATTLLLDEPTAGVDADSELRMADALEDLSAQGSTIVLVTHELGAIAGLATRVVVLGGRAPSGVTYDGPPPPPTQGHGDLWHHSDEESPAPAPTLGLLED
jgi:zinc transport system ATP-binding protein